MEQHVIQVILKTYQAIKYPNQSYQGITAAQKKYPTPEIPVIPRGHMPRVALPHP